MKTFLLLAAAALILFILYVRSVQKKMKNTPMVADHEKIVTLTDKNFSHKTKGTLMLVDFWASWCAPCRMMAPILNDLSSELEGNRKVGKLNIEQFQSLAVQHSVKGIPTMILFRDGKEVERFVGVKDKNFLLRQMNKYEG